MEEWEYVEGHKDLYQDIVMMGDHRPPTSPLDLGPTRMEKARKHMAARILHLSLEIIHLITGEDYTVVKKWSGECVTPRVSGGSGTTQSPTPEDPPPHSLIHEQKILELTTRITELLTGEVPIRCQDVTVYFSMEEWEYIKGHKDLYQDMIEDRRPLTPDEVMDRNPHEKCPRPLYSQDGPEENVPEKHQEEGMIVIKVEEESEEEVGEEMMRGYDSCMREVKKEIREDVTPENPTKDEDENFMSSLNIKVEDDDIMQFTLGEDLLPLTVYPGSHSGEKTYSCSLCGKCFTDTSELLAHERKHVAENRYSCPLCEKGFPQKLDLVKHQETHVAERPYLCLECGQYFTSKRRLVTHEKSHTGEDLYACSECERSFTRKSNLIKHVRIHRNEKPYSCSECGKCFIEKSQLVTHEISHIGENHSCSECGKCFLEKSHLAKHQRRSHSGEKPYSCSVCGKCFVDKSYFVIHMRIHTGEKPYSCSECEKCFSSKLNLLKHKRIHTGEKPHSCSECGKCFTNKSDLVTHTRIHTGEKPYSCSECGKCFKDKNYIVRHLRSHSGEKPYSCSECGKCFIEKSYLLKHLRSHSGEKSYSC
ncbi:zinc finger protein 436-like isoform X1 [Hyla sarda]|uniref:zinc finger protein 436-like isoform X1 n=3 Tax=Hyla sarda TaxID=327740 RepID=UPI0024C2BC95|nr:zinc finger protein 436-like isoform X1 [Hyla sarda]